MMSRVELEKRGTKMDKLQETRKILLKEMVIEPKGLFTDEYLLSDDCDFMEVTKLMEEIYKETGLMDKRIQGTTLVNRLVSALNLTPEQIPILEKTVEDIYESEEGNIFTDLK